MPDWGNAASVQRYIDEIERRERERLTALKLWRQGERTAGEVRPVRPVGADSPYAAQAQAESQRRQAEAQRRAQDSIYAEQIRQRIQEQQQRAMGDYRAGEIASQGPGTRTQSRPATPAISLPVQQVSGPMGQSGLGQAAPLSSSLAVDTVQSGWSAPQTQTGARGEGREATPTRQQPLAQAPQMQMMGGGAVWDKWVTDAVDWWRQSAAGQAAAQRWQAIVEPPKQEPMPSMRTAEGWQQYGLMAASMPTTSEFVGNWLSEQANNAAQPEWFRAVAAPLGEAVRNTPDIPQMMPFEYLPKVLPGLAALWSKGADAADNTSIGKAALMAGGGLMTGLQAGDDTLKIMPLPGKGEYTVGQFLSSLGRAVWDNPWLIVDGVFLGGRATHEAKMRYMEAYDRAAGGPGAAANGSPKQWALLNVYSDPKAVRATYDDLMMVENKAGVIAGLTQQAQQAQASGDALKAAEIGAQIEWWKNARPVDVVDKHTELLPELVFTMLFDWTNLIGFGFDLAKLGPQTRRMASAVKAATADEGTVLRSLEEAIATTQAAKLRNGDSLLGAAKAGPAEAFVGLTNEARATQQAADLFTFFTQLLGDVKSVEDARLLVAVAAQKPQELITGLRGLTGMGDVLQADGAYKVGAGLFNTRVIEAVPTLLEARQTLLNLPSLNAEKWNPLAALAEIHDALFASAYRVHGLADWAMPQGTKAVRAVDIAPGPMGMPQQAIEYLDEQGNVISRSAAMKQAEAQGEVNKLNRWIAEGRTENPAYTALRAPDRLVRGFISSAFLNLMPGHWVRNAVSGMGHLMTDGVMTFEKTDDAIGFIANQFGGALPLTWMREAFQATGEEGATASAKAMGAPARGSYWDWLGKGNLLSRADAAGSEVWTGGGSIAGRVPVGEMNMRLRGFIVPFRRGLQEEWGKVVTRQLGPVLDGLGVDGKTKRKLISAVVDAAVYGNKREVVPAVRRFLDGTASSVDMQALGLANGSISPDAYRTIRQVLDVYMTSGDRAAAERAINEALDAEQLLFARILADTPAQPGRQTFTELENVQDFGELLRDVEHAARKAGADPAEATRPVQELITQYKDMEPNGYAALMQLAAEQPTPQVRALLFDTWAQIYDAKIAARQRQGALARAAMEDPALWQVYPQQITEVWREFFTTQERLFQEAMGLMTEAQAGRYVSSAPAGSHGLLEKLASIDTDAAMRQMGQVPKGLHDPEYQAIIDAGRSFQDQAAATMYTVALRYGEDVNAFDHVISAEIDVRRMSAAAAAKRAEIAAKYPDLRNAKIKRQYYKEMSELWGDFWFATSGRYHAASMEITTEFVTRRLAPDASFVEPWADPFGRTLTLLEPVETAQGRRWRVLDMDKKAVADDLIPEEQIPPEAIQAWERAMSGPKVRQQAAEMVAQVHREGRPATMPPPNAGAKPATMPDPWSGGTPAQVADAATRLANEAQQLQQRLDDLAEEAAAIVELLRRRLGGSDDAAAAMGEPPAPKPPTGGAPAAPVPPSQGSQLPSVRGLLSGPTVGEGPKLLPAPRSVAPTGPVQGTAADSSLVARLQQRLDDIEQEKAFYRELLMDVESRSGLRGEVQFQDAPRVPTKEEIAQIGEDVRGTVEVYTGKPSVSQETPTAASAPLTRPESMRAAFAPGDQVQLPNGKTATVKSATATSVTVEVPTKSGKTQTKRFKPENVTLVERPKPPAATVQEGMALAAEMKAGAWFGDSEIIQGVYLSSSDARMNAKWAKGRVVKTDNGRYLVVRPANESETTLHNLVKARPETAVSNVQFAPGERIQFNGVDESWTGVVVNRKGDNYEVSIDGESGIVVISGAELQRLSGAPGGAPVAAYDEIKRAREARQAEIRQRLSELAPLRFEENVRLSEIRQAAKAEGKNLVIGRNGKPVFVHDIGGVGKEGQRVWKQWSASMGDAGAADIAEAKAMFLELYNKGAQGKQLGHQIGGAPFGADERLAYEAGKRDASAAGKTKKPTASLTPIHDEIVRLEQELEELQKPLPLEATPFGSSQAVKAGDSVTLPDGESGTVIEVAEVQGREVAIVETPADDVRVAPVEVVQVAGGETAASVGEATGKYDIIGYEWRTREGERYSAYEGGLAPSKISDWDNSEISAPTGRKIVHVYWVREPDGTVRPYGKQAAAKAMGWSEAQIDRKAAKYVQQAMAEAEQVKAWARDFELRPKFDDPVGANEAYLSIHKHPSVSNADVWMKDGKYTTITKGKNGLAQAARAAGWENLGDAEAVAGLVQQRAAMWAKRTGRTTQGWSDPARKVEMQYEVIELDDLVASHTADGRINPQYPAELQPRDRSQAASQLQVREIAGNLAPEELLSETNAIDRGAPIVGAGNVVESGNGRTMALRSLDDAQFAPYRAMLLERAQQFGIDPAAVEGMRRPVLVRRRLTEVDPVQFAAEANARTTLGMNMAEQSGLLANALRPNDLQQFHMGAADTLRQALAMQQNQDFVRRVLAAVPANERAMLVDANGMLTTQGTDAIRAALFNKVFGANPEILRNYIQAPKPELANVGNGLERAVAMLAQLAEVNPQLALGDDLATAAGMLMELRRSGTPVETRLNQLGMFEQISEEAKELLRFLDANARSGRKIGDMLTRYAESALLYDPNQLGMFAQAAPDKLAMLQTAMRRAEEGGQSLGLFDSPIGIALRPGVPLELKALWAKLRKAQAAGPTTAAPAARPKHNFGGVADLWPASLWDVMSRNDKRIGMAGNLRQPTIGDVAAFRVEDIDQLRRRLLNELDNLTAAPNTLTNQQKLQILGAVQQLMPQYDNVLAGVTKGAQAISDFAMLDYGKVHGFDTAIALHTPFHFWFTRSAKNWLERSLLKPSVLASYLRIKRTIDQQNERENTPARMSGTIGIPNTQIRIANPYNLLIPYQTLYELNDFGEETPNPTAFQRFVETAKLLGFGMNPLYDSLYKVANGRGQEIQAGDFAPQYRLINYLYKTLTGNELPGAGDEYDPYRDARTLARMVQAGAIDQNTARWLQDRLYQRANGVEPLPEEAAQEKAIWDRLTQEAAQASGFERLVPLLTRSLLGVTAYALPQEEQDIRQMQAARRGLGYGPDNAFGSQAAVNAFDAQSGYDQVQGAWMGKDALIPQTPGAQTPAPPTYPFRQPYTPTRPGVAAVDAQKKEAKAAIRAEMDAAVEAALAENPRMTPAQLKELKAPFYDRLDALDLAYPSATNWAEQGPRDFYGNMNPAELLESARQSIVYRALDELAPMKPQAGAPRQAWDAYNAALEQRVAELMNDPQALSAEVYGRPVDVGAEEMGRGGLPTMGTPSPALPTAGSVSQETPVAGLTPGVKTPVVRPGQPSQAQALIDSVLGKNTTPAEQAYWERRDAEFAARDAMWAQRKANVYATFGEDVGKAYEAYLALPSGSQARKEYKAQHPELRAVSLLVYHPQEYNQMAELFGQDGITAWAKLPPASDRKARAAYYDANPKAFLVQAWVYGRPGKQDEQDTAADEAFRYNFGADYKTAEEKFGADIWQVVAGYRRGWDKATKAAYYRQNAQLSPFFDWWYGNLDEQPGVSPYANVGRAWSGGGGGWSGGGGWRPQVRMPDVWAREMDRSLWNTDTSRYAYQPPRVDLSWLRAGDRVGPEPIRKWRRERLW